MLYAGENDYFLKSSTCGLFRFIYTLQCAYEYSLVGHSAHVRYFPPLTDTTKFNDGPKDQSSPAAALRFLVFRRFRTFPSRSI